MNLIKEKKEEIRTKINSVIANSNCNLSILIKDLNDDSTIYEYNSRKQLVSASLIKVPILLAVLEKVRRGYVSLNDMILVKEEDILEDTTVFDSGSKNYTLLELLNWMIILSDNTATNVLIHEFGLEDIDRYIKRELQLKKTSLQRKMLDFHAIKNGYQNYTSQEDMLKVFTKLFNKEILTDDLCDLAIEILSKQRCQDQIMRYIYENVFFAHKTGALDYLNHDVGVMNINNHLFYIGISIYDCKDKEGNKKLSGMLAKMIYNILN